MFLENLDKLMSDNGLNKRQLSLKSGVPYTTIVGFYEKGYEKTKLSTLRALANYFHVTLDYLVYGESNQINTSETDIFTNIKNTLGENIAMHTAKYIKLDNEDKSRIDERMDVLLENEKYKEDTPINAKAT